MKESCKTCKFLENVYGHPFNNDEKFKGDMVGLYACVVFHHMKSSDRGVVIFDTDDGMCECYASNKVYVDYYINKLLDEFNNKYDAKFSVSESDNVYKISYDNYDIESIEFMEHSTLFTQKYWDKSINTYFEYNDVELALSLFE